MAEKETKSATAKIIDLTERVTVKATKEAPYHEEGEVIKVAPAVAEKMIAKKWAVPAKD